MLMGPFVCVDTPFLNIALKFTSGESWNRLSLDSAVVILQNPNINFAKIAQSSLEVALLFC